MHSAIIRASLLVVSIALLALGLVPAANAAEERDRYIVVFEDSVQAPGGLARAQVEQREGKLGFVYRSALQGYSAELPVAAADGLRRNPLVKYVTVDGTVAPLEELIETIDHEETELFEHTIPTGVERVFAVANKVLDIDGQDDVRVDADVAVIDTGSDHTHADLNVVARTNCSSGTEKEAQCVDGTGTDTNSHGTHVAGTIGAIDNGIGVVGIAPGARIWAVKVLGTGVNYFSEVIAGVDWVTAKRKDENPANDIEVVNMSLGCSAFSAACPPLALNKAIEGSVEAGIVHVVAAGNSSADSKNFTPANNTEAITVSALADYDGKPGGKASPTCANYGLDDRLASFSNWGATVDVTAPGVCTLSTVPGGYGKKSGTSMASPLVAGAAAILAGQDQPESQGDVEAIRDTIVEEGNFEWTDTSGDGVKEPLLDVGNEAVFNVGDAPEVTTEGIGGVQWDRGTLHGTVSPGGPPTDYQFEYGTTTAYGSKAPASPASAGSGTKAIAVDEPLTGLNPRTTYHYRLVATNAIGSGYGADRTFTTPRRYFPRLEAQSYPATISGGQVSGSPLKFKFHGGNTQVACSGTEFSSTLSGSASQLTTQAKFTGCTQGENSATINMKSCSFVLAVANSGPPYTGSLGISCTTGGDAIEIATPNCVVKLAPQTVAGAVSYAMEGMHVRAAISAKSLAYANTSGICVFLGPGSDGELNGAIEYAAANGKGEAAGLYVSGAAPTGLELVGEESAEPSKQPRFAASAYPVSVAGEQVPANPLKFKFHGGNTQVACGGAEFDSTLSGAASQLTTQAKFTGCTQGENSATINMKSCSYVLAVANSGPPYTGSLGISCTTGGDAIEIATPNCVVKLAPQTVSGAVSYAVEGTGGERHVRATISTKSLTYANASGICIFLGPGKSDGELNGAIDAYGFG